MADIARMAGVSASTVSRAFNNSRSIPPETRQRILDIAQQNNYRIDTRAQNFRLQRSMTIATVFPYGIGSKRLISDPFYLEITAAVTDELANYDYDMILARVPTYDAEWCLRYASDKRVDGIILVDRGVHDRGIEKLLELGANFLVFGPPLAHQPIVSVGCNTIEGAVMGVRHLIRLGRKRIGFIGGNEGMVETYLRRQGYERALKEADLPINEKLITYTDFTPQAGQTAMNTLLDREPKLDAVFICSDFMAVSAIEDLRMRGRVVPDDVSIVGYDDIPLAAYANPRLTTIRQPIHDAGRLMVKKLFDMIENKTVEPSILPFELVVRDSCGANRAYF